MREVKKKSAAPIYLTGAVWVILCLVLPLYRLWHFIVLAAATVLAYQIFKKLFPPKTVYVEEPEPEPEPNTTGTPEYDELLRDGETAVGEMRRLRESIPNEAVKEKIDVLTDLTNRIFRDIIEDPSDYKQIRRFADYFMPTTLKMLNAYDRMSSTGVEGENISGTMARVEDILDTTIKAYRKQLDSLFENQALDIETDISVLEAMLKKEGLAEADFATGK